jgi:sulfur-oxidizing protein SoxX
LVISGSRQKPGVWFLLLSILLLPPAIADAPGSVDEQRVQAGKKLVQTRSKGNCLACHAIGDGALPGNLGPPLMSMKLRFPDREQLRKQIWDATQQNPDSRMPPFGKHGILSAEEIELVIDYLYTL